MIFVFSFKINYGVLVQKKEREGGEGEGEGEEELHTHTPRQLSAYVHDLTSVAKLSVVNIADIRSAFVETLVSEHFCQNAVNGVP